MEQPAIRLHSVIFRESRDPVAKIADGIPGCVRNARRLYEDAKVLVENQRFTSASYLLTVMSEELAKVYILVDMLRLDWTKHMSTERKLCQSFYSHGAKYAYLLLNRQYSLADMNEAKDAFRHARSEREPGDEQSGAPEMPSWWKIQREWSQYVDHFPDSSGWFEPSNDRDAADFGEFGSDSEFAKSNLLLFEEALAKHEFDAINLRKYHVAFSKHYFTDRSEIDELMAPVHSYTGDKLQDGPLVYSDLARKHPLFGWPLYYFSTM